MRGRVTGGTNQGGAGNGTQVNHRLTARHRRGNAHRSVFSFGRIIGNKHRDPARNQEVPSPEGFTVLAAAEARK